MLEDICSEDLTSEALNWETGEFEGINLSMLLKCLKCGAPLQVIQERCVCPQCQSEWPIAGGIPRFFQAPDYYWGEVGRHEAQDLLAAAREGSWVHAIRARFPEGHGMAIGLLDLQRASWATMLGLDAQSVALDVGSGYGAITHSLSRLVREVYSIEAIPERIEFTYERMRQEHIENVRLIQASAIALPLLPRSFDLVVANGILEWVGEWDRNGDSRAVQVRFLSSLHQLLKDDGVLVVGIENRIGYNAFLGGNDHSGIPYTSLVPRRIAGLMLRLSTVPHHRTTLNPAREYRTYTYSERGYRKLLGDAGFREMAAYWADPGYNQPYHLIPLDRPQWVREHYQDLLDHPSPAPRQSWRRTLKAAAASSRLVPLTVPEFVLFASKQARRTTELQSWVEKCLLKTDRLSDGEEKQSRRIPWALWTVPFKPKSVIRLGDPKSDWDLGYLKASIASRGNGNEFETEAANRTKMQRVLEARAIRGISVPQTYETFQLGNISYCLESAARGSQLCRIIRRPRYFADLSRVGALFSSLFEKLIGLTEGLQQVPDAPAMNPEWREIPEEFQDFPELRSAIQQMRYFVDSSTTSHATWIQHGDFSIENISLDPTTDQITLFDWVDMAAGFPPLYDFFEFLYSTGYLSPSDESVRFAGEVERWTATFNAIFFNDVGFASVAESLLLRACERLGLNHQLIPALLLEFLIIRTHYYRRKSATQRQIHLRLLQRCLEQEHFVFGKIPLDARKSFTHNPSL